jgi:hypothetical protein
MVPRWQKILAALTFTLLMTGPASAVGQASVDNRLPGLSGYWRLTGKGNAQPVLTAHAKAEMAKPGHQGDVDVEAARWCVFQGLPYGMDSAGPIEIRQAPAETIIIAEHLAVPRHIYFRLNRPSPDVFDFTPVGMSTGRRVGNALVVKTDMFADGLGPDGVPRTEKTQVVERFQLLQGGRKLAVTATWTDPAVFVKPYVYTWTYDRIPENYTVQEYYCDPRANGVGNYPPGEDPHAQAPSQK